MMQKMGWSEGKGLGKNEEGMVTHIKLKKRAEELGEELSLFHV
jgi:Pin2-interacting protein X1